VVAWEWMDENFQREFEERIKALGDQFPDRASDPESVCLKTVQMVDHGFIRERGGTHVRVPHRHPNAEEIFYIIKGNGTFQVGDEKQKVKAGDIVYIPPNMVHLLTNDGYEILEFIDWAVPVGETLKKLLKN